MFYPYHNFFDSYLYYAFATNQSCFNYDPYQNQRKILSNIVLTENEDKKGVVLAVEDKIQDIHFESTTSLK